MTSSTIIVMIAIAVYLIGMLAIGAAYSKRNKTSSDFYLGGRKLGPIVIAMSTEASDMSSWLLMGVPGLAYFCGLADASWTVIGLALGTYLNWLIVAKRLRIYSQKLGAITIPDFFAHRFGDKSGLIEGIAALIIIIFFVPYTASGFAACGKLFTNLFPGSSYIGTMLLSAAVIVGYCAMGGFLAASITSLIQSIVMTIALFVILIFGIHSAGGWDAVIENAKTVPGYLDLFSSTTILSTEPGKYGFISIVSTMAWGLGYFGMPHILLRLMGIRDEKELVLSRRIAAIWCAVSMGVAILIGIIGYSVSLTGKIPLLETSSDSETIIIKMADLMSQHGFFFALMAGVILAGILAATMSTADSQLLAAASSVSQDLMQDFLGIKMDARKNMIIARATVIGIAVIAIILAWNPNSSVFRVVSFAWAGFGATFGPTMLLSLFWKRSNKAGALAGLIVGGAMVFIWKFLIAPMGGILSIYELLPAFILSLIVNVIVSLVTPEPDREIQKIYDEVHAAGK